MKIAIAANTRDSGALVAMHAARAPFYLFYDEEGTLLDVIVNPYSSIERGAAPRVAHMLQEHGIETLVAGEFGGKFITLLEENNINIVPGSGLVSEVIKEVLA